MQKQLVLLLGISLMISCASKQPHVDKIYENGVETILNHLGPYVLGGKYPQLQLEEKANIDFGSTEFEKFGFERLNFVEADSEGNIYVAEEYDPLDCFVNKFDKNGKYVSSFGRHGEGPGEIQRIYRLYVNSHDRIFVSDMGRSKVIEFDRNGDFIGEVPVPRGLPGVTPLENGNFVVLRSSEKGYELVVLDSNSNTKSIDSFDLAEIRSSKKTTAVIPLLYWRATPRRIYVGNEQRGYEIRVFDLNGNLLRKIRKEYRRIPYPDEFKELTKKMIERDPHYIMLEDMPPFNSFFVDDAERLYVMTYEKGERGNEFIHDIYNSDGVFIARKSLGLFGELGRGLNHRWAIAKNGFYYCLEYDEESGNSKLVMYEMKWR